MIEQILEKQRQLQDTFKKAQQDYLSTGAAIPFLGFETFLYESECKTKIIELAKEVEQLTENHPTLHFYVLTNPEDYKQKLAEHRELNDAPEKDEVVGEMSEEDPLFIGVTPSSTHWFTVHECDFQWLINECEE